MTGTSGARADGKPGGTFLSVVIPAYNEVQRIGETVKLIHEHLTSQGLAFEIIVVNDGSTDGTDFLVGRLGSQLGCTRLISYAKNRGKGHAVKTGVLAASGDFVLISDADLSAPIEEAEKLLSLCLSSTDIAFGSRALPQSTIEVERSALRHVMGRIFNAIVRIAALPDIRDTQCGFKCLKGPVARELFESQTTEGFAFDVELLLRAKKTGCEVREVPIRWVDKPSSTVRPLRDSIRMLADVFRITRDLGRALPAKDERLEQER